MTDFGLRDHYVASMKGVILGIAPQAAIVDVTHEIRRHDITQGAFILRETAPWFPAGAIHVAVVDPGVGTQRRIIAARCGKQVVIAPDNGLVSLLRQSVEEVRVVENPRLMLPRVSGTFHGRDVMAPVAAALCNGAKLADVGPPTDHLEILQLARPRIDADHSIHGEVLHVDSFGNLITNIHRGDLVTAMRHLPDAHVHIGDTDLGRLRHTYAEAAAGEPLAIIGSGELLEIAVNRGSAAERFGGTIGAVVIVR